MPNGIGAKLGKIGDAMKTLKDLGATQRFMVVVDASVPPEMLIGTQEFCAQLADYTQEPVEFAVLDGARMVEARAPIAAGTGVDFSEVLQPRAPVSAAPMSSAEFVWREDGRPDWGAMWTGFCELALYGGPPHRGEETALHAPESPSGFAADDPTIAEIRRGIWETTGLFAEPAEPGWIAVTCHSRKMAAWLCATIVLENVDARFDEERLFLPASPSFNLKNEVKSIITVLAKTNHYWEAHIAATEANAGAA